MLIITPYSIITNKVSHVDYTSRNSTGGCHDGTIYKLVLEYKEQIN